MRINDLRDRGKDFSLGRVLDVYNMPYTPGDDESDWELIAKTDKGYEYIIQKEEAMIILPTINALLSKIAKKNITKEELQKRKVIK